MFLPNSLSITSTALIERQINSFLVSESFSFIVVQTGAEIYSLDCRNPQKFGNKVKIMDLKYGMKMVKLAPGTYFSTSSDKSVSSPIPKLVGPMVGGIPSVMACSESGTMFIFHPSDNMREWEVNRLLPASTNSNRAVRTVLDQRITLP